MTTDAPRPYPDLDTLPERAMLEAMLDWYRDGVLAKVAGVAQATAVATPLGSATSIAGLVKHLALVDWSWFGEDIAGEAPLDWYAAADWDADRDWEFHTATTEPIELQVQRYRDACDRSKAVAARFELDDLGTNTTRRPFTLRFVYLHMIEETARHLGHLDILRELIDGSTGE